MGYYANSRNQGLQQKRKQIGVLVGYGVAKGRKADSYLPILSEYHNEILFV